MINILNKYNKIKVETDEKDNRINRLYLIQKGRDALPKIEAVFLELADIFTKDLLYLFL